jgi:hypothetical protein
LTDNLLGGEWRDPAKEALGYTGWSFVFAVGFIDDLLDGAKVVWYFTCKNREHTLCFEVRKENIESHSSHMPTSFTAS